VNVRLKLNQPSPRKSNTATGPIMGTPGVKRKGETGAQGIPTTEEKNSTGLEICGSKEGCVREGNRIFRK